MVRNRTTDIAAFRPDGGACLKLCCP